MRDLVAGQIDIMIDQASNVAAAAARRHDQGLRRHAPGTPAVGARRADRRRGGPARSPYLGMARACGRQGRAGGRHRQAERRRREGAWPSRGAREKLAALGQEIPPRRPADAAGARCLPEGRDREVVADRQGRGHQGRMTHESWASCSSSAGPAGTGRWKTVYAPRARAHRDHGSRRLRRGVAGRASLHDLQRLSRRCTCWARWPRRAPSACASARRCRWPRSTIRCGWPRVALLDMLSGGRVNWGAGRGFAPSEFNAFGVPAEESARALPRGRRDRPAGLDAASASASSGTHFSLRRHRGAAQAAAAAASAGLDGGDARRAPSTGRPAAASPS